MREHKELIFYKKLKWRLCFISNLFWEAGHLYERNKTIVSNYGENNKDENILIKYHRHLQIREIILSYSEVT